MPVAAKYGEQPIHHLIVTLSAQNTDAALLDHLLSSPSHALKIASLTSKCDRSTSLFMCKLCIPRDPDMFDVIILF